MRTSPTRQQRIEWQRAYYKENREEIIRRRREAYHNNPEVIRQRYSRVALYRLNEFIEKHEVTLNAMGKITGIPPSTLRGYKRVGGPRGYRCPLDNAKVIADYFGVTVAELAGEEEE